MPTDPQVVGKARIYRVPNSPRDLVCVQIGPRGDDGPCGVGDTIADAFIDLGQKMNHQGGIEFDDRIRKLGGWE